MADGTDVLSVRQRVRAEAVRLFALKGFAAVGIRELADAVGIRSATLYHYVGSKDDLLLDIMRDGLHQLLDIERAALTAQDTPPARLAALVGAHAVAHALAAESCRVVDVELRALAGEARAEVVGLRAEVERLWTDVVAAGTAEGWFRSEVPVHTSVLALLYLSTGVAWWFRPEGRRTAEEIATQLADVALHAVDARREPSGAADRVRVADLPAGVGRLWDLGVLADPGAAVRGGRSR